MEWLERLALVVDAAAGPDGNALLRGVDGAGRGDLGPRVLFALDATDPFDRVGPDGDVVPAEQLARVTAAILAGEFGTDVSTAELLA